MFLVRLTPAAFVKAAREVNEYRRFRALIAELTALNERICRQRAAEPDEFGWTEEEKKAAAAAVYPEITRQPGRLKMFP
jgi:hypothetical protein